MSKYRKRPVVVDAFRWTGDETQEEDPEWIVAATDLWPATGGVRIRKRWGGDTVVMEIMALEGMLTADLGYWIVRGVEGEICPVRADIFEKTYEKVDGNEMDDLTTTITDTMKALKISEALFELLPAIEKFLSAVKAGEEKGSPSVVCDPIIIVDGYEVPPEYKEGER